MLPMVFYVLGRATFRQKLLGRCHRSASGGDRCPEGIGATGSGLAVLGALGACALCGMRSSGTKAGGRVMEWAGVRWGMIMG